MTCLAWQADCPGLLRVPAARLLLLWMLIATLLPVSHMARAEGAGSPEALAMALVNAYRHNDANAIVAMHYFVPTTMASVSAQQHDAKLQWRKIIRGYDLRGYRVSNLSGQDRHDLNSQKQPLPLTPIKKLTIDLVARHGSTAPNVSRYIGSFNGRFYFIAQYN